MFVTLLNKKVFKFAIVASTILSVQFFPAHVMKNTIDGEAVQPKPFEAKTENKAEEVKATEKPEKILELRETAKSQVKESQLEKRKAKDRINEVRSEIVTSAMENEKQVAKNDSSLPKVLNQNGEKVVPVKKISGKATAYTARKGARTSTGTIPTVGTFAVDPKVFPYSCKMLVVCGDKRYYGIAKDTGGAMRRGHAVVDLYMNTESECLQFGRRNADVYML
jgi:3D (Asp-Asp-Asp) domain-containing protein